MDFMHGSLEFALMQPGVQVPVFNVDAITWYVQHPVHIEPPAEEQPPAAMPLMLTKKVWPACPQLSGKSGAQRTRVPLCNLALACC